ncbi:MAG: OB-fold nucleic acid binding domain-containing protein [Lachnospiraceae bacterium]|nr:OB-fold nucleic acid binding domain-containing protein [Lachnospiraceae bacterium]MBQ8328299.1 OB-fold nucleic acid binding domain-containing protein [Lachnospiraceae bacterium]
MKKALVILLTGAIMAMSVACGGGSSSNTASAPKEEAAQEEKKEEETVVSEVAEDTAEVEMNVPEDPMTYEEYAAAAVDTEVVIKGAVQAKQAYYGEKGVASVYLQDETGGAYFLYELPCTEKEYELLEVGKFIKVKGYKAEWSGEVEVVDAIWQFEDGEYIAEAEDVTALLGTDELISKQNKKVVFKGVKVEPIGEDGTAAFLYNWDGSGAEGDDLYFNVSVNGQTYSFTVESYLCGPDTDIYKAVKDFHVGDVIDLEGFLYWYEGPNPHITAVLAQ